MNPENPVYQIAVWLIPLVFVFVFFVVLGWVFLVVLLFVFFFVFVWFLL